jgi:hypothetical protein
MEGYCVSCKCKQTINEAKEKTTSNGRQMMTGKCSKCNTKMSVFVPGKKSEK